jgi:hypothetical protein
MHPNGAAIPRLAARTLPGEKKATAKDSTKWMRWYSRAMAEFHRVKPKAFRDVINLRNTELRTRSKKIDTVGFISAWRKFSNRQ